MTTALTIAGVVALGLLTRKLIKKILAEHIRKTWELE